MSGWIHSAASLIYGNVSLVPVTKKSELMGLRTGLDVVTKEKVIIPLRE
jgi:hypothetical protein